MNITRIFQGAYHFLDGFSPRDFLLNPSLEEYARRMKYSRDMR